MPQRFLRPGITNSTRWNSVSAMSGNLFIRLLTLVDDFGRTDGRTSVIFGACFSVWNECHPKSAVKLQQVAQMLQELLGSGLVDIYETENKRILQIEQWQERIREGCKAKYPEKPEVAASCSDLLPSSPSPSPASNASRHCSNGSHKANTIEPTDEEWIKSLSGNDAYEGIDVKREHARMVVWCKERKRTPSRRRFINWLNKIERPMRAPERASKIDPAKIKVPSEFKEWAAETYPKRKDEIDTYVTWAEVPDWMRVEWRQAKIDPLSESV